MGNTSWKKRVMKLKFQINASHWKFHSTGSELTYTLINYWQWTKINLKEDWTVDWITNQRMWQNPRSNLKGTFVYFLPSVPPIKSIYSPSRCCKLRCLHWFSLKSCSNVLRFAKLKDCCHWSFLLQGCLMNAILLKKKYHQNKENRYDIEQAVTAAH